MLQKNIKIQKIEKKIEKTQTLGTLQEFHFFLVLYIRFIPGIFKLHADDIC